MQRSRDSENGAPGDVFLFDSEVKGFGLRVKEGSGAKTYILQYRAGRGRNGAKKRLTIGRHGSPWTPETARKEAIRLLGEIAGGADPAADRAAKRQKGTSVADLCDSYLTDHVGARNKA
jgi:hypothetical protein